MGVVFNLLLLVQQDFAASGVEPIGREWERYIDEEADYIMAIEAYERASVENPDVVHVGLSYAANLASARLIEALAEWSAAGAEVVESLRGPDESMAIGRMGLLAEQSEELVGVIAPCLEHPDD
ncbi:MAG: hypothetical protein OXE45_13040 [bacterium]|nr:hypothetical protein [bacterium]